MADHQSKADSIMESLTNTAVGYCITLIAARFIFPAFGVLMSAGQLNGVVLAFTIVSVIRGYLIRRIFNGKTIYRSIKEKFNG